MNLKRFILIIMFTILSTSLLAQVGSFSPVIDGVKDSGWGTTPTESAYTTMEPIAFNLEDGCYVTDDSAYIYIGVPTDDDPWSDGNSIHFHIAFDVNNTTGGGNYDAWGSSITYGQTYLPDYDIIAQWSTDDQTVGWTGFESWNGTSWNQTQLDTSYIAGGGDSFTEIAIPRLWINSISQNDTINFALWIRPDASSKPNASSCLPQDDSFPTDWGNSPAGTFTSSFSYVVQSEMIDLIAPTLVSAEQTTEETVDLTFSEDMDDTSALSSANYQIDNGVTVDSVSALRSDQFRLYTSGFTSGVNYTVTADSSITDLAGNNLDENNNTASFTAVVYAEITFKVDDSAGEVYSGFYLKGSWDEDGYYDVGWGGGVEHSAFYDDGTHGDLTPNDHIYTVVMQLVVDDSSNTWEWGVNDAGHNWIDGNWQFWLPDSDPQIFTYEVPYGTSQAVTVTFQVDMSLEDDVDSVFVAGDLNGWNPNTTQLFDADEDDIYSGDYTFPQNSSFEQEFKYVKNGSAWEGFSGNRNFTIDDTSPTQVLDVVYFGYHNPTELNLVTFMDSTVSNYTNFASGDTIQLDDSLFIEAKLSPADSNGNSGYWAKLHYQAEREWLSKDFSWNNNYGGNSYWHVILENGVEINNGDSVTFYVEASDYNGPIMLSDNNGSNFNVSLPEPPLPEADFTASPRAGWTPLEVDFTDLSSNSPDSWFWDFGDGDSSTEQNPTHTYDAIGTYTVSLTVTNSYGSDTKTRTDYIEVQTEEDPPADFTAEVVDYFDVQASWSAPSQKAERDLQFYRLHRNGSVVALVYPPTTSYLDQDLPLGTYTYYVTAKYTLGETQPSDSVTLEISDPSPDVIGADQVNNEEVNIYFSRAMQSTSATNTDNYSISPTLTINGITEVNDSTYRLLTDGFTDGTEYTVTVDTSVTDINGYGVDPTNNTATFTALAYAEITFIVDDSGAPSYDGFYLKGSWNEDGYYDASWGGGAEHTPFYDDGTHGDVTPNDNIFTVITYLVPDDSAHTWQWGINDASHNWIGGNWHFWLPDADPQTLIHEMPYGTTQEVTVTFQVNMSLEDNVDSVFVAGDFNAWNPIATQMTDPDNDEIFTCDLLFPEHSAFNQEFKFVKNGDIWEDFYGNRNFIIDDSQPTQVLDAVCFGYLDPTELNSVTFLDSTESDYTNFVDGDVVTLGDSLFFEANLSPADSNANSGYWANLHYEIDGSWFSKEFVWNNNSKADSYWRVSLNNGEEVTNGDVVNFYVEASDYNGPVLTDDNGGVNYEVSIEAPPAPLAEFEADELEGYAPLEVNFTDLSTNYPDTWQWDLGDGNSSTEQNPTYTYQEAGYFSVSLTVSNAGGQDTETKTDYIHVLETLDPPTDFTASIVNYFDVQTDWNAPTDKDKELQYYRLYRNGSVCAVIYPPSTSFLDEELALGMYEYYVTAKYTEGESGPSDTISVEIINMPPVAEAGPNQTVDEGEFVTLDGSASYDPEEQPLSYCWNSPSTISLSDSTVVSPTFTAPEIDETTVFTFSLIVNDGYQNSEPDTVLIEVEDLFNAGHNDLPQTTYLFQNYPNPVINQTNIRFSLKQSGHVSLQVYNIKGEKVTTLIDQSMQRKTHEFKWNLNENIADGLTNGIYFYKLITPDRTLTKKLIIMQ